jgi:phosphoribosylaminoimidazolecarboxamide formyltransferase/IMP cyclohydrolase
MTDVKIARALLSVSDKTGLAELGQALARHQIELVSTGGTPGRCATPGWRCATFPTSPAFPR